VIVVAKLREREEFIPVILLLICEESEVLLQLSVATAQPGPPMAWLRYLGRPNWAWATLGNPRLAKLIGGCQK